MPDLEAGDHLVVLLLDGDGHVLPLLYWYDLPVLVPVRRSNTVSFLCQWREEFDYCETNNLVKQTCVLSEV